MLLYTGLGSLSEYFKQEFAKDIVFTSSKQNKHNTIYLNLKNIDLFNYEQIPTNCTVLMAAAISSPDYCESSFKDAFTIDVIGTIKFIEDLINKRSCRVLFFSSDVVYGDTGSVVADENSPVSICGAYALFKFTVEKYFKDCNNFISLRLSYILSRNDNFIKYILNCIKNDRPIDVYKDFVRNITPINYLLEAIRELIDNPEKYEKINVINICGGLDNIISRSELLDTILNACKIKYDRINYIEAPSSFWICRPKVIRTKSSVFKNRHNNQDLFDFCYKNISELFC